MTLVLLAFLAGALTIASPCILPVLPFVFARSDRPFAQGALPLLAGMALTFAGVTWLAALGAGWVAQAHDAGRVAALVLMALFALALLLPRVAGVISRPLVGLGARLAQGRGSSFVLGIATGLLWAPCAGPVLGLVFTTAALQGAGAQTAVLLLAYAAGAAVALATALLAGARVVRAMRQSLPATEWLRRAAGAFVLASVAVIALGWDTAVLARASRDLTGSVEERLLARAPRSDAAADGPSFAGATGWLHQPLALEALRGKVVLVNFWTYSCINCLRTLPFVRAWASRYADQGLVVVGVHTPEFAFERNVDNVRKAATRLGVTYPVAVDNGFAVWRSFRNSAWPALYLLDANGRLRHQQFGEGGMQRFEQEIRQLLGEAHGSAPFAPLPTAVDATGAGQAADFANVRSPETYVGSGKASGVASPGGLRPGRRHTYSPGQPRLNQWGLGGDWSVTAEHAELAGAGGSIVHRFHARDLHLVMGAAGRKPARFRVTIDGKPPGEHRGGDIDAEGYGEVGDERLYQLVRQSGAIRDRTFEIRFLEPGVRVFAFTFG